MNDWTDRLSDYLDGDMPAEERVRLEAALREDADLRQVLEDLRDVRDAAAGLPARGPASDLWPDIESRIRAGEAAQVSEPGAEAGGVVDIDAARKARRRIALTIPQLAAAAVALLLLGSASVWLAIGFGEGAGVGDDFAGAGGTEASLVAAPEEGTVFSYDATVEELEAQLREGRDRLDPKTVAALEGSIATIDRAIERAREALEADPASVYLNRHLADARARKLRLLQQAARLATS